MAWNTRSIGLTGFALSVNYIAQHPATKHLNSTSHELLIATVDGVYHSVNGGRSWAKITLPDPSNAEFNDSPAAVVGDLAFVYVDYDPTSGDTVYVLAQDFFGAGDVGERQWIYKSGDNLATWTSRGILTA